MSVDNRVVKLQFDNQQFEKGVSQSMSTLDKLEEKLKFKDSAKGFSALQTAAEAVKFDKLVDGIESINKKLSATGVLAAKFVSNIAESVANGVKKVEQASLGQIKSGGWARAMKIENAKFAVQGLKGDWDELYKAIDYSVSGTAYGVDSAAKAASTLMASGVDYMKVVESKDGQQLTQMHKSLRAISGVAAQTNSEFDDIAHIFTTVAGNGRLMADQLNQLSGRGMNAAAILGEQLGMTEAAVREATSKGQIDFKTFADAMDSAFGDHAKDANKTFTGSLSNMKAALSRFGAVFATPIIQKTNTFFIALTGQINKMKKAISDTTENGKVLEQHLEGHFAKMWENLITLGSTLVNSVDLTWFEKIANSVDGFVERLSDAFEIMNAIASSFSTTTDKTAKKVYDTTTITEGELTAVEKIIKGEFGNGAKRKKEIEKYLKENDLNYDPDKLQAYVNVLSKVNYIFEKAGIKKVKEAGAESEKYNKKQESVQKTFINIYSAIHNFNAALSKLKDNISEYFDSITKPFGGLMGIAEKVTGVISDLVLGFDTLVDAIKPTSDVLYGFYDIGRALSDAFDWIVDGIRTAIQWLSTFITSVIDSWKESGVLTNTLINIAETIRNLTRILKNLATSAGRIFKAVATAFFRVFNPEKASDMLSRFTGGLADISDKFLLSEEAADVLTDVLTGLFTVIDGILSKIGEVVIKITEFVGGFKKVKDTVSETTDETDEISDSVDETTGKFDKLIEIGTKVKDFFKDLGKNFTELIDELKKNEGIQHLKDSLKELGDAFKDSVQGRIDDFKEGLEEVNEEAGTKFTVKDLADGIGKFADNVAGIVDKIPDAVTKIENLFDTVWKKAKDFFDKIKANATFTSLKEFFDKFLNFGKNLITDTETTFKNVGTSVINGLEGINWKDVLSGSFVLGALAFIIKLSSLAEAIENVFVGVDGIIEAVGTIAKNAAKLIGALGTSLSNISKALMIASVAMVILAIAGALYLVSQIDENRLYDAASIIILILAIVYMIIKALQKSKLLDQKILSLQTKKIEASKKTVAQVIAGYAGIAFVLFALGKSFEWIVGTAEKMADMLDKYDSDQLMGAFIWMGGILGVLLIVSLILVGISKLLTKKLDEGSDEALAIGILVAAFAVVLIAIGAALLMVSVAAESIANLGDKGEMAIESVTKIMIVLFAGMVAIILFSKSLNPSQLVTIGVLLLEVIVAMMIIFGGIYFLALSLSGSAALGKLTGIEEKLTQAVILVCAVLGAMALAVMLMSFGISSIVKYSKNKATVAPVAKIMLGMIVLVGVILAAVIALTLQMQKMNETQIQGLWLSLALVSVMMLVISELFDKLGNLVKAIGAGGDFSKYSGMFISLGAMMLLIFAGIAAVLFTTGQYEFDNTELALVIGGMIAIVGMIYLLIKYMASKITPDEADVMKTAGNTFLMIGASILIIAIALGLMANAMSKTNEAGIIAGIIALVVIFGGIAAIIYALVGGKYAKSVNSDFIDLIKALGLMFIEIGAMMLLIAFACQLASEVSFTDMLKVVAIAAIVGVLLFALSALFGMDNKVGEAARNGLKAISITLIAVAAAFLIFGVALQLSAIGIAALTAVLPAFGEAFSAVCEELSKHQGIIIGLGALVVIILLIVAYTILKTLPIIDKIVTAVVAAVTTIAEIVKSLGKKTADGISNFHKNKKLSAGVKATIVTLITALASSLVESGPEVLQKIGDFLWMIIDWLISIIPKLLDKLVDLLLELIWGLLDAITNHINEIEAAIKGILLTIGAVVIKVLADLLADGLDALLGWIPLVSKGVKKIRQAGDAAVGAAKETTKKLKDEARARDKAIQEGGLYNDEDIYGFWDDVGNSNKLSLNLKASENDAKELEESTKKVKEKYDEAFKNYASIQKNAGRPIDWNKTFLYASEIDTDKVNYNELQAWLKQGTAFYSQYDDAYYKIMEENAAILDADPLAANNYAHYYTEAKKKTSGAVSGVTDGLKDGLSSLKNVDLSQDSLSSLIPSAASPDAISLDSFGLDTNQLPTDASNLGTLVGGNAGQSTEDALSAFGVNINDTTSLMGEDGAASFNTAFDSGLVGDATENERAADMVADTTAKNLADKENQDKVKTSGGILSSAGAKGVTSKDYLWIQAGGDVIEGLLYHPLEFINGTANETNTGAWLADHLVHSIYDPFVGPRGFNIGSPSKVMEKVGNYIIQGLANGINSETEDATNAMSNVSDMMMSSFTNPLNYVMQMLNGELQYDPSIRPVLDTSNIASGAYGINSMFDNQNVTLSGLSGTIAADIGRLDNSNADIIKELRALRTDVTDMGKEISNMQVVMDSGRLVGAIASDMDSALGGRSSYSYRGKGN